MSQKIGEAKVRALAVAAIVDPRTIRRVLDGKPVRGDAGERARKVLIEAGLLKSGTVDMTAESEGMKK